MLASCKQSRTTISSWVLKHNLRPQMFIISTVRAALKISRRIKGEGTEISNSLSDDNRAQQAPLGRRGAQVWWGGPPQQGWRGAHPRVCRRVVLETSKSQDISLPIPVRKRKHREKLLFVTYPSRHKRRG